MAYYTRDSAIKTCATYSEARRRAAALYPVLAKVFKDFDGKVYNVRLERALQEAAKPEKVYCQKRYRYIEIYTYIGHGNGSITLAQISLDDLVDGKRIPADKLIESAQKKRETLLQEAADVDRFSVNMDMIKEQLAQIKKTYNAVLDGLPYLAMDILNAQKLY